MHRLAPALAFVLAVSSLLAGCAHDPLDEKSGEEDFASNKAEAIDAEGKPRSVKAEHQEADLKKEEDELEQVQFKVGQERDAFLAEKQELKELLAAQHQRDLVLGRKSNTGPPSQSGPTPSDTPKDEAAPDNDSGTTVTHHKKKTP